MPKGHSTNPEITAERILRLKSTLRTTYFELAQLFGVRHLTVMRWAKGTYAPRLCHQRTLIQLEKKHGIGGPSNAGQ